jgi:hypothetical protein
MRRALIGSLRVYRVRIGSEPSQFAAAPLTERARQPDQHSGSLTS